jgi:hypothetical protein
MSGKSLVEGAGDPDCLGVIHAAVRAAADKAQTSDMRNVRTRMLADDMGSRATESTHAVIFITVMLYL